MTAPDDPLPKALTPPSTSNTLITTDLLDRCVAASRQSPRKRMILPLHKAPGANLHRMLNAIQPGSYIQPHRHLFPPKAESVIVLQGAIYVFIFNQDGSIDEVHTVKAGSINLGIDSEPGVFHTFAAIEEDTVLFEVKPGPYNQADDKDFAPWAPAEGAHGATEYLAHLYERANKLV
ncbi:MAG: cupin fold WbuC family metalloprotein [Desulforhopalus sp.]|jgi:cupin fold WbuC family metalloprotein